MKLSIHPNPMKTLFQKMEPEDLNSIDIGPFEAKKNMMYDNTKLP